MKNQLGKSPLDGTRSDAMKALLREAQLVPSCANAHIACWCCALRTHRSPRKRRLLAVCRCVSAAGHSKAPEAADPSSHACVSALARLLHSRRLWLSSRLERRWRCSCDGGVGRVEPMSHALARMERGCHALCVAAQHELRVLLRPIVFTCLAHRLASGAVPPTTLFRCP